jgi:hypothetical protein
MSDKGITKRHGSLGSLELSIDQGALEKVVKDGRLLEFAATLGREAAAQISAQVVDQLAQAAVGGAKSGVTVSAAFIFDGGDFGTVPPRPKWGIGPVGPVGPLAGGLLQQLAAVGADL